MRIVIVGAGKLGSKLAEALSQEDNDVTIIDVEDNALQRIRHVSDVLAVKGNGLQVTVLEQLNIRNTSLLIAVTSSDESNVLICTTAKKLGCKQTIARIRNPDYANQLDFLKTQMEIDYIVNPERETAREIAKFLLKGYIFHMEHFAQGRVGMMDFRIHNNHAFEGKRIRDLSLPDSTLIAAIEREGTIIIPHGNTELKNLDSVYIIGKRESINLLSPAIELPVEKRMVKNVLIIGGGKPGYYLADKLLKQNLTVKIIEQDEERCAYLAEQLEGALVLHGDGADMNLLKEENLEDMDALVSLTGFDEENLLLALLGKKHGIGKVIAKVSKPNYVHIIEQLGIDLAVSPVMITAAEILRFIQGGRVASLSLLLNGQAEVLEVVASEDSRIVGQKLADLGLPKGIIISTVVQKSKVIIPDGNTVINPGDRFIVFCLQSEVASLEKFFYRPKRGILGELWNNYKGSRKSSPL